MRPELLKSNPYRTVLVESRGGVETVVKRFHHPRWLQALRDAGRARRECRLLETLHRAGLPVPRPLGVARGARGWEVRMERVEGALELDWLFAHDLEPVGGWNALMERLGVLETRLRSAGFAHPDLHPGNVIVDAAGSPYLIDFHKCRRKRLPRGAGAALENLVRLTAMVRDFVPANVRARFLASSLRSERRSHGTPFGRARLRDLGEELEARGRERRRARVARGLGRWWRASSRVEVEDEKGQLLRITRRPAVVARNGPGIEGTERELDQRAARTLWLNAARLHEHGLAVVLPLRFTGDGRRARIVFEVPAGARPVAAGGVDRETARSSSFALGRALGRLHDRGLDPADLTEEVLLDGEEVVLGAPLTLREVDPEERGWDRLRALGERRAELERPALVEGYVAAFADRPNAAKRMRALIGSC